jgi:maltooligosyltrehalose trehalohydrolase
MSAFQFPITAGALIQARNRTRFRFFAPAQERVALMVEDWDPIPMQRDDAGWFTVEAECGADARYRYRLQDGLLVPDPASRLQTPDVHDRSIVYDPETYTWRYPEWKGRPWQESVIYELHAGLLGGYAGVADQLPAIADIGVTAIQLMPIADFPGRRNWGYDGVLPYAPDTAYGDPHDLKALVDRAHELGLNIFLDVVYNHFGPDGNYMHAYAPDYFREDIKTPWGAALDFRHPELRRFFKENVLYWLMEYRFDGLRFDAVHAIHDGDWLEEVGQAVRETVEEGRQVHLILENEHNDPAPLDGPFDAQWNDDFHHCVHVLLTGESAGYYGGFTQDTTARLARSLAEGFVYQGETAPGSDKPRGGPSAHLPPTAFINHLQNHDQIGNRAFGERLTTLTDAPALEAAIGLLLLAPQIPMIFMGEETGSTEPFLFFTDHHPGLAPLVRDGRRKEFAAFPEFADPHKRETIPDPNDPETFERSRPVIAGEGGDMAREDLYRTLLGIRRTRIAPHLEGVSSLGAEVIGEKAVLARWQLSYGGVMTLACNLSDAPVKPSGNALPDSAALHWVGRGLVRKELQPHSTILWIEENA